MTSLSPAQQEIAALWQAHASLGRVPADDTRRVLAGARTFGSSALALLLRARMEAREANHRAAFEHYQALHAIEPEHDAFWLEEYAVAADAVAARRTIPIHTRDATAQYQRFIDCFVVEDKPCARMALQEAWRMEPLPRATVAGSVLGRVIGDSGLSMLVNLHTPDDPPVADLDLGRRPMRSPRGTRSTATGMFVRVELGTGSLDIPGGAAIAPAGTEALTARDFERVQQAAAIRAIEDVSAPSLDSAAGRRIVEAAVESLSENNRWERIAGLTQSITPDTENLPASLIAWRVRALVRLKRNAEARQLATGSAMRYALQRETDAGVFLRIADLLGSTGAYDEAMDLVRKAGALKNAPDVARHLRKLDLRRILALSPPVQTTPHFSIHATEGVPVTVAERIGQLLEEELARVSPRFGLTQFNPVRVNVVKWEAFSNDLTGSEHILGMYDGEITIPFGEVPNFRRDIVAILTHEMTHAVLAQASNDNAPRWMQEGVAQRMELVERQESIFHLHPSQQFIALELLDPTMQGSVDPEAVADAYVLAQTFIRYLEDRHGPDSIHRLVAAFAAGSSTEQALLAVTKQPVAAIDRDFRAWGVTHAEAFVDNTKWPYDDFYSLGIDPKVRAGFRFTKPREERRP